MGLQVFLKQPSSTTGPSPLGSMGLGAGQVKTETQTNFQNSLSVLCHGAKSTLSYHMSTKQDTNPCNNNGQAEFAKPV